MSKRSAVILAAGKGTRLGSEAEQLPKVMRLADGKALLAHVLDAIPAEKENITVVVGYMKEKVMEAFPGYDYAEQTEQKGTGHAVMSAAEQIKKAEGTLLIAAGDMPLIRAETYEALAAQHEAEGAACTILVGSLDDGGSYGRIIRGSDGEFVAIREAKDCTEEEKKITEVNSGIYAFDPVKLLEALPELTTENAQGEYYLTDVPALMLKKGHKVSLCVRGMTEEIMGVNTREDLAAVEAVLRNREA